MKCKGDLVIRHLTTEVRYGQFLVSYSFRLKARSVSSIKKITCGLPSFSFPSFKKSSVSASRSLMPEKADRKASSPLATRV